MLECLVLRSEYLWTFQPVLTSHAQRSWCAPYVCSVVEEFAALWTAWRRHGHICAHIPDKIVDFEFSNFFFKEFLTKAQTSQHWQKISSESFNGICHKKKIQESTEICGPAAQKNTFSKIIRQRKSSNWMRQIGSMLRELLLTFFNFLNPEFEHKLEGWKFTMTDRSLYLS